MVLGVPILRHFRVILILVKFKVVERKEHNSDTFDEK